MKFKAHSIRRAGFSLSELMVVIALIAVLTALLMPAIQGVRDRTKTARCANNLRQIGQGLLLYASDRGTLPHASHHDYWADWCDKILPYMITGNYVYYPDPWQNGLWQDTSNGEYLDRDYTQAKASNPIAKGWAYFTCPAGPTSPTSHGADYVKYPHNYGCNEWMIPQNYWEYEVGNRAIPAVRLANIERPGSVILACDTGIFDPSFNWGAGDSADTCWQFKVIIENDFVNNPTTAHLNGTTACTTPTADDNDAGTGNGYPVYSRHRGLCNAVMADGHVEGFRNGEIKRRNWVSKGAKCRSGALSYVEVWYP